MANNWPPMRSHGRSVTESEIAAFETRMGIVLPDDYRRFLLEVNGGRPASENTEISQIVITGLLSLGAEHDSRDLEKCAAWARHVLPHSDLMLVGYADGALILLAHDGPHRGEVWSKDMVDPRPSGANPRVLWHDRRDMEKLSDSFEEFMRKLGPLDQQARAG
jgi:SMI1 / KNR4 family (SUKH-1)